MKIHRLSTTMGQGGLWLSLMIALAAGCAPVSEGGHPEPSPNPQTAAEPGSPEPNPRPTTGGRDGHAEASPGETVQKLSIQVLASYPHDPTAFTQGLLWHGGELYESTGLYGRSSIRRTVPESGQILAREDLERHFFAEGLALVDNRLIQLTWKAGLALVYDPETLSMIDQWGYNGEGWGLTYDGEHLIMSDGSPRLTFRSKDDFRWLRTVEVTYEGKPLAKINELEYVDGQVYANVWGEERIVRLDPKTGVVNAVIRASNLLTPEESRIVDVLNGIAYDPESETFWLTGKFWPRMFQVKLVSED